MPMTVRACPMMVSPMMSLPPAMTVPAGPPCLAESVAKMLAIARHCLQAVASLATALVAGFPCRGEGPTEAFVFGRNSNTPVHHNYRTMPGFLCAACALETFDTSG